MSAGVTGFLVPGCSTGEGGAGRSGAMLYQWVGIWLSGSTNFVCSMGPRVAGRSAIRTRTGPRRQARGPAPERVRARRRRLGLDEPAADGVAHQARGLVDVE